jgi:hypothetical protein
MDLYGFAPAASQKSFDGHQFSVLSWNDPIESLRFKTLSPDLGFQRRMSSMFDVD